MSDQNNTCPQWLRSFASLNWYEETIKFIFNFVTKTSELLLAAGIVISTANFLTDGDIMSHNKSLSDAWSWAQALAIDSSLGIVFMNAYVAVREREKIKAVVFITLTALLATVAGLITHFDALGHAAGLPVTDKGVSGIIPLWVMTALRAVAVIGFLLASRLKNVSLNELRRELDQEPTQMPAQDQIPQREPALTIDYHALAVALVEAMRQVGAIQRVNIEEELEAELSALPELDVEGTDQDPHPKLALLRGGAGNEQQEPEPTSRSPRQNRNSQAVSTGTRYAQKWEPSDGNQPAEAEESNRFASGTKEQQEMNEFQEQKLINGNQEAGTLGQWEPQTGPAPMIINTGPANERLMMAYQAIQAAGDKITGETLSKRACVRKQTALEWLRKLQEQENDQEERAEGE
jgi:hypothetical protein